MVGLAGFEPTTSCPPDKRANQAALQPEWVVSVSEVANSGAIRKSERLASQGRDTTDPQEV